MGKSKFYKEGSQVALNRSYNVLQQQKTFSGFTRGYTHNRRRTQGLLSKRMKNRKLPVEPVEPVVDNDIYFLFTGGYSGTWYEKSKRTEIYNYTKNTWAQAAMLNVNRADPIVVSVNGVPYVLGGTEWDAELLQAVPKSTGEVYDRETDSWIIFNIGLFGEGEMGFYASQGAAAAVNNNKIYMIGGRHRAEGIMWTPGSVSAMAAMPAMEYAREKYHLVAVPGCNELLALGGILTAAGGGPAKAIEKYNIDDNTWTTVLSPDGLGRWGGGSAVIGTKVYMFGGEVWDAAGGNWIATETMDIYDYTTNTWVRSGESMQGKWGMGAWVVHDGKIHVHGGRIAHGDRAPSLPEFGQIYTPGQGWATSSMTGRDARGTGAMVVLGAQVSPQIFCASDVNFLLIGGQTVDPPLKVNQQTLVYNYTKLAVAPPAASIGVGRIWPSIVSVGGVPYVLGGYRITETGGARLNSSGEFYNSVTNSWTTFGIPYGRSQAGAAVKNNNIYIIGGFTAISEVAAGPSRVGFAINSDTLGQHWDIAPLPRVKRLLTVVALPDSNELLAIGGVPSGPHIEKYNIDDNTWTDISGPSRWRWGHGSAVIGTKVYVFGGKMHDSAQGAPPFWQAYTETATMDIYDYTTNTWSESPHTMNYPRFGFAYVVHDGKIHVYGGAQTGGTILSNGEIYTPDVGWATETWTLDFGVPARFGGLVVL